MSVLLIPNPTKDTGLAVTRQAAAVLAGLGVPVLMPQPFANEFGSAGLTGVHFLPEADAYHAADQVVTIGGDGTLLRAGLSCMKHGKPVLGVNLGRTGFLATCEVGELTAKLKRLAAGSSPLPTAVCSTPKPQPTAGRLTPSMTLWCSVRPGCTRWIIRCTATAHWWAATAATA
ncbi:NAD(+)/NADH kinase [Gemmiger formicilis]|nr:NAD(+)/NADH kinase [Gemmiger formicilis]